MMLKFRLNKRTGYPILFIFVTVDHAMTLNIRYFASLKESLNRAEETVSFTTSLTVRELWATIHAGKPLPTNILVAINMDYVGPDSLVKDGDEVAFFPPVTGG